MAFLAFAVFGFAFRAGAPAPFRPVDRVATGERREDPAFPERVPFRATGFLRGAAFFATFLTFATPRLRLVTYVARVRQFFGIQIYKWCNECQLKYSQTACSPLRRVTCRERPS